MPIIKDGKKTKDLRFGDLRINKVFVKGDDNGNLLVYVRRLPSGIFLKKPDYSSFETKTSNQIYKAGEDIWFDFIIGYADGNYNLYVSKKSDMSNSVLIADSVWHASYSGAKGGNIVPIPKGLYYRGVLTADCKVFGCIEPFDDLPYDEYDITARLPDYFTGQSVVANTPTFTSDDIWVLLRPTSVNAKQLAVADNPAMTNQVIINNSNSYSSSPDKGSTLTFIPKGLWFKGLNGTLVKFDCLEVAYE